MKNDFDMQMLSAEALKPGSIYIIQILELQKG